MSAAGQRAFGRALRGLASRQGAAAQSAAAGSSNAAFASADVGAATPFGARAANLLAVKTRMKSVTNVQKITKAMKMVAASKLKGAQAKCENSRGIWQPFYAMFGNMFFSEANKVVMVPITSDKGLCGGVNSSIVKYTRGVMNLNKEDEDTLCVVGDKGKAQLIRSHPQEMALFVGETQKVAITFDVASMVAEKILESREYDKANVIFNRFVSVISNKPVVATVASPSVMAASAGDKLYTYEFEDGEEEALQDLSEFMLATTLYNGMLENATAENGARMNAMDNSSRNAGEMLEKLTLIYNRGRQAAITTELIEIISGATALEG